MQRDAAGMRSLITDDNSLRSTSFSHINYTDYSVDRPGENHVMAGFPVPSVIGEAMSNYVTMPSPDELWNAQPEKNSIRDFSTGNTRDNSDQFLNGVPFSGSIVNTLSASRYCPSENQVKLTTSNSLSYPFEHPKTTIANNSCNVVNSSFQTMNHGYNESLVFGTNSTQWDFNHFMNPPELLRLMAERGVLNSSNHGSSRFSNELSLSLATSQRSVVNGTYIQEQRSGLSSSGYSSHKRQSESASCSSSNLSLSSNSHKPPQLFPVLSGSRFFHAMQEILAEIASYALENFDEMSYNHSATGIDNGVDLSYSSSSKDGRANAATEREVESKKKHLLDLLQMVDDQYNQCVDEIHTVISAFHAVTELDPNLHARFALPTISFMYKNLRERISSHILAMGATVHSNNAEEREDNSFEASFIQKQWALQQLKKRDQLWRPQRGLPERSVSVLRAWMFQNFLHPYPKDSEKHLLALKSGLTRSQVSNWFINARVRLWKPMIEEMYAEMNRRKIRGKDDKTDAIGNHRNLMGFESRRFTRDDMDDY